MALTDEKDLSLVLKTDEKRNMAPGITNRVVTEMKSSLIFEYNWEELLVSAPVALSCMGACYIATSSSGDAESITLDVPTSGWKYLRHTTLRANLTECGDLGRFAFIEAESGMGKISLTSTVIYGKVGDIIDSLSDPPSAKRLLKPQMNNLKVAAQECYDTAVAMDRKFEQWLMYVCEMHAACVQRSSTAQETLSTTTINLAAENSKVDYQTSSVSEAKKATELLEKQMDTVSNAYKKASDTFPSGWDIMGQQIVSNLADCVTTALNQAIPVLVDRMNPLKKVKAGADIVGAFIYAKKEGAESAPEGEEATSPSQTPARQNVRPQESTDPAYSQVIKDLMYLNTLNVILTGGPEGDIDWEKARGGSLDPDKTTSVSFVQTLLSDAKKSFATMASEKAPSMTYMSVLSVSEKIASDLVAEVKKAKAVNYDWPARDSKEVQKWQKDFETQYSKALQLNSVAKSLPGSAANGIPLMTGVDPAIQVAQVNAKTAQAQAVLESAKNRLNTTQQAFLSTQQTYAKSTELLVEQQNKLAEIKSVIAKLTASALNLKEIKAVLIECIKLVISLKEQITNLVRFFKAMATIIDVAVKYHVDPFLETIKATVAADGADPNANLKIGNFTLTDLQRSCVYNSTCTIRSYFGVFCDIANMWKKVSIDHVTPGLTLCGHLSKAVGEKDEGITAAKARDLAEWSQRSQAGIKKIAEEKRNEILSNMESRVEEIAQVTRLLPPPPKSVTQAIESGAKEVKETAIKAIEANAKAAPLSRFAYNPAMDT